MQVRAVGWSFCYEFEINAIVNEGFWYTTSRGDAVGIEGIPNNMGQWKNDFFFYPFARSREFRMAHKWRPARCLSLLCFFFF